MAVNPIEILKDTLDGVTHAVTIDSVTSLGGGEYKLDTCFTYYLRTKKKVTIDSVEYSITDFSINSYITVKATSGDVPVTASSFTIDPPLFVWGNPQMVSAEMVKRIANGTIVWPYIWAVEISSTSGTLEPSSATPITPSFNLFFLDSADKVNWTISDHYNEDIYPLNNYIDFFFKILRTYRDLFEADGVTYTQTNYVNFGDYIVDEGMKEHILNDEVTGIQLQVSIPYTVKSCNKLQIVR